jgi:hypothetical protein
MVNSDAAFDVLLFLSSIVHLVGAEVSFPGLHFTGISFVLSCVFLQLHRLHLLLDCVHGGGRGGCRSGQKQESATHAIQENQFHFKSSSLIIEL